MKIRPSLIQICLLSLLLLALPAALQAQFNCTTNADGVTLTITGYTGSGGAVTIPDTIDGLSVISIGPWSFYSTSVISATIPDSVTSIGDGAFFDCESLTNVIVGDSVTNIGDWTFAFCSSLTTVCFRGNAHTLGGANVFYGNLAAIYYLPDTTEWEPTFGGHPAVLWNQPVPYNYTTDNDMITITGYTGSGGVVNVPSTINFLPVTSIGDNAFYDDLSLTSVTIPNSVTSIGSDFAGCTNLTNVTIGTNVTTIGQFAFTDCTSLTSVTIPDSVTSIGDNAFVACGSLTSITIPASVTNFGEFSLEGCNNLPGIMVSTNNPAYSSVEGVLFDKSQTTLIAYPDGKVGNYAIPDGVTGIDKAAFLDCDDLTNITIPNSVTNIGDFAFWECISLTNVYFQGNAPSVGDEVFGNSYDGLDNSIIYYLPGTTGWGDFSANTGVPTALWFLPNPLILNNRPQFGLQTNGFGFTISWATNLSLVVEACTNLTNPVWTPISTNALTNGVSDFSDPQWTNHPSRFYRLSSP